MGLFNGLFKAAKNTVLLPVDVVRDTAGIMIGETDPISGPTATGRRMRKLSKNAKEIVQDDDED